jgi:diguanylate cyclase (GGDEF)-like protein
MRVLAIDDSPAYRRVLESTLRDLGHQCVVADDGLSGWGLFCQGGIDVVISNWIMPGMDGEELCRRIRHSDRPYAYFILFSAREGQRHVVRGMRAGADDYLSKPLKTDELESCLIAAERVTKLHRELSTQQDQLQELNQKLFEQSRHDELTGVGNRLRMEEDLAAMEENVARNRRGYAIALCDVDHFKGYNDAHGHPAGDQVLRAVARALRQSCRKGDGLYRYGGEELLVLMPEQDGEPAATAADRLRKAVADLGIDQPTEDPAPVVTISVGVAVRDAGSGEGLGDVLLRADAALYEAKRNGRNRVEVSA